MQKGGLKKVKKCCIAKGANMALKPQRKPYGEESLKSRYDELEFLQERLQPKGNPIKEEISRLNHQSKKL